MPKLVHSRDGKVIKEYDLKPGVAQVGRRPDCEIRLDDVTASGHHAQVITRPSQYMDGLFDVHIEDKGSTNGTYVNGKRIKRYLMKHGDIAKIGQDEFALVDEQNRAFERTEVILPEE